MQVLNVQRLSTRVLSVVDRLLGMKELTMYTGVQCTEVVYLYVFGTGLAAGDGRIDNVHWCSMCRGCVPLYL